MQSMITPYNKMISKWYRELGIDSKISFDEPKLASERAESGINFFLIGFGEDPVLRNSSLAPISLKLVYLVTPWASSSKERSNIIFTVLLAALENELMEVEYVRPEEIAWSTLNIAPQASFFLKLPVKIERAETVAPSVTRPLKLRLRPGQGMSGKVSGPGDVGLANALVSLPDLNKHCQTDKKGQFRFESVPSSNKQKVVVKAKGRSMTSYVNTSQLSSPVEINFKNLIT